MRISAVIFDLDGVLVSTDAIHFKAWKQLADREGIYFDETINDRLRGVSRMASLDIILERAARAYTDAEKLELAEFKNSLYVDMLDSLTPEDTLPGARDALSALRIAGYRSAVGSSSRNAGKILRKTALLPMLDAVADGNDVTRSKPAPDIFLKAAEKLGLSPDSSLVVEDAEAGIRAAKAAGMYAVAVGDAAEKGCGDSFLESLAQLPKLLEKLNH